MVVGIGDPMSSKTLRCKGVGTESCSIWTPWLNSTVFLVRVPRWANKVAKLWITSPSASSVASFASVTLKAYSHVLEAKNQEAASIMGSLLRPPIQLEGERIE